MISYQAWQNSASVMGFPKYSRNCRQWDLNPCRHLFMKPSLQAKQDNSSGRDETKFVSCFTFPPQAPFFWSISVWIWPAMWKPEATSHEHLAKIYLQAWQQLSAVKQHGEQLSFPSWTEALMGPFSSAQMLIFTKFVGADIYEISPLLNW